MTPEDLKAAAVEGRSAEPGAVNPYIGDDVLARAWHSGYRRMLSEMLKNSPQYRAFVDAQK
jgi:hypothetical protein